MQKIYYCALKLQIVFGSHFRTYGNQVMFSPGYGV
jgi:hypothetical protein